MKKSKLFTKDRMGFLYQVLKRAIKRNEIYIFVKTEEDVCETTEKLLFFLIGESEEQTTSDLARVELVLSMFQRLPIFICSYENSQGQYHSIPFKDKYYEKNLNKYGTKKEMYFDLTKE